MFAGHIGVALAAARAEPRVNLGLLVAAALLLDILLWLFVLCGWETVVIPADFAVTHQPEFVFPYSHGLLGSVAWSTSAAASALLLRRNPGAMKPRAGLLIAGVVFSHWLLDALVHRPELPITGAASPHLGLGLWNDMPLALAVEAALMLAGVFLYFPACGLARPKKIALGLLVGLLLAFTVAGMTVAPPPPSDTAMAASSLATIVIVCALMGWLGRGARESRA